MKGRMLDDIKSMLRPYADGRTLTPEGASRLARRIVSLFDDRVQSNHWASMYTLRPNDGVVRRVDIRLIGDWGWCVKVVAVPNRDGYLTESGTLLNSPVAVKTLSDAGGFFVTSGSAYRAWLKWENRRDPDDEVGMWSWDESGVEVMRGEQND